MRLPCQQGGLRFFHLKSRWMEGSLIEWGPHLRDTTPTSVGLLLPCKRSVAEEAVDERPTGS